jgi:ATP-dependent Lon protease
VNKNVRLGSAVEGRDEVGIKKTVCAFLKLLHPSGDPTPAELDEYLAYAVEGRRRVKEQMNKRKTDGEYARINLSFIDSAGTDRVIFCEESKGSDATLNPTRRVIDEEASLQRAHSGRRRTTIVSKVPEGAADAREKATRPESFANVVPAQQAQADQKERHYKILYGSTGHTYESIFGSYVRDAKKVEIEDPYIRSAHQIGQFIRFCELLVKTDSVREIKLVTGFENEAQRVETAEKLESLAQSLLEHDIKLVVAFNERPHDREVRIDNGWHIKIGRGLDIYQPPESWFVVGANDLTLRPCLETMVDVFRV